MSNTRFIECSIPEYECIDRGVKLIKYNSVVNLDHVLDFKKIDDINQDFDSSNNQIKNSGRFGIIFYYSARNASETWVFQTKESRDFNYKELLTCLSIKIIQKDNS